MGSTTVSRQSPRRIAIVGAGISGLAAAHRIVEIEPAATVAVFESGARAGGVLSTVQEDGFQVEQSADNFITTVPWGLALCKRLGLADDLTQTNTQFRQTYVVCRGKLHKLPDGFLMMAPSRLWPLAVTPILSPLGKLRAALEYFIPPREDDGDESMAAFVRRRLGREVFERLVEPLVSSVYAADMEKLSLDATLSQFREMERKHGSLIRAMRERMKAQKSVSPSDSGARYSMFVTLRQGLGSLTRALVSRLPEGSLRLNTPVVAIERTAEGRWLVAVDGRDEELFDALVIAAPSYEAARLLKPVESQLASDLAAIAHSGTVVLSVGYPRQQISHPLDGMGAVVPSVEGSPILAISFSSQKYPHRAPEGQVLLRIFAGGARRHDLLDRSEADLESILLPEAGRLLGIRGEPVFRNLARWPNTMPQYHLGHKDLVSRIETQSQRLANFSLAGNAYHGVGMPHCIHSGELAAERVLGRAKASS